jgi:hypothetical protein
MNMADVEQDNAAEPELEQTEQPPASLIDRIDDFNMALRFSIFEMMCSHEIDGGISVENMDLHYQWIKEGKLPASRRAKRAGL